MIDMEKIIRDIIPAELYQSVVVLYGAGTTGRRIIKLLEPYRINIKYVVDDDMNRWGTKVENIEIISYQRFKDMCRDYSNISVVLTTIYGKVVLDHLRKIPDIKIYEMYEWLDEVYGSDNLARRIHEDEIEKFRRESNLLKNKLADEESAKVLDGIYTYMCSRDMEILGDICTTQEQYFISEVMAAMQSPLELVDGGAYVGEMYQAVRNHNIQLGHWYCFEADEDNYRCLVRQSEQMGLSEKQECIKKGLWETEEILYFDGEKDACSRIVDYQTSQKIETVSLDSYLNGRTCNFIKMDIEGAEYPALRGAMQTIKRDRPILAISIYHSLEDYFRIPNYLMEQLDHYRYYIRHHALILSETVLYAIPE